MRTKLYFGILLVLASLAATAGAQSNTFTYQGRLTDNNVAAGGTYEMQFRVFDAATGGLQQPQPSPITLIFTVAGSNPVPVVNGAFTVQLNFGAGVFTGANRWLEISVRKPSDPPTFTLLTPRQPITSSPYAIQTISANIADSLSSACVGCVGIGQGGTGANSASSARTNLGAAASGINSDVTQLTGLTTPLSVGQGGTGSGTKNFVDLSTTQNVGGSKTFTNGLSVTGNVVVSGGVDYSSRVVKTAPMTGTDFANNTIAGVNVCPANYHPMTAWEAMVIDMQAPTAVFDVQGWVIGSFPNTDFNLRSLANGQDSTVCPAGSYLTKYFSNFVHGAITTRGGIHCASAGFILQVWCARNRGT